MPSLKFSQLAVRFERLEFDGIFNCSKYYTKADTVLKAVISET